LSKGIPDESGDRQVVEAVVGNPAMLGSVEVHTGSFHPVADVHWWNCSETDIAIAIPLRDAVPRLFRGHMWLLSNCYGIWEFAFPCT
jgi:hypothetical protein